MNDVSLSKASFISWHTPSASLPSKTAKQSPPFVSRTTFGASGTRSSVARERNCCLLPFQGAIGLYHTASRAFNIHIESFIIGGLCLRLMTPRMNCQGIIGFNCRSVGIPHRLPLPSSDSMSLAFVVRQPNLLGANAALHIRSLFT